MPQSEAFDITDDVLTVKKVLTWSHGGSCPTHTLNLLYQTDLTKRSNECFHACDASGIVTQEVCHIHTNVEKKK